MNHTLLAAAINAACALVCAYCLGRTRQVTGIFNPALMLCTLFCVALAAFNLWRWTETLP